MRPLILGREFLYDNELKVYYSKTGNCRLDHKVEKLIATVDICRATGMEECPKVTLDIQCLWQGGGAALMLMINYFLHREVMAAHGL